MAWLAHDVLWLVLVWVWVGVCVWGGGGRQEVWAVAVCAVHACGLALLAHPLFMACESFV
jgi:hypothetical protein